MRKILLHFVLVPVLLTLLLSCGRGPRLVHEDWAPDVKEGINEFLDMYRNTENAYAVFDFDNTSSIFDVGVQLITYQLETMAFAVDAEGLRTALSGTLLEAAPDAAPWIDDTVDAYAVLYDRYGPFTPDGVSEETAARMKEDPFWKEFTSKIRVLYERSKAMMEPEVAYGWLLHWLSGMSADQAYSLAFRSHMKYSEVETSKTLWQGPDSFDSRMGQVSHEQMCGIQVTENIRELWKCLSENGIDVWVCSASGLWQIMAAIDAFGLHDCCTGVLGMTVKTDENGCLIPEYDLEGGCGMLRDGDGWKKDVCPVGARTAGPGKVAAILNAIAPKYGGRGPVAGFMDATGDFNFCTEFSSLRMVVCFNCSNRGAGNGGGLIAEVAIHQRDDLGYDLRKANAAGDTMYFLQGRDENGLRRFRPSNMTVWYGTDEEHLFSSDEDYAQLELMKSGNMSTEEALNRFSSRFLKTYSGYHSIK